MHKRNSASAAIVVDADGITVPALTWKERLCPWAWLLFWKRWCGFWRQAQREAAERLLTTQIELDEHRKSAREASAALRASAIALGEMNDRLAEAHEQLRVWKPTRGARGRFAKHLKN